MGCLEDMHQQKLEELRAAQRLEEAKAATALAIAAMSHAAAEHVRAEQPVKLAKLEAETADGIDIRRIAAEERSETLAFWSRLAALAAVALVLAILATRLP